MRRNASDQPVPWDNAIHRNRENAARNHAE